MHQVFVTIVSTHTTRSNGSHIRPEKFNGSCFKYSSHSNRSRQPPIENIVVTSHIPTFSTREILPDQVNTINCRFQILRSLVNACTRLTLHSKLLRKWTRHLIHSNLPMLSDRKNYLPPCSHHETSVLCAVILGKPTHCILSGSMKMLSLPNPTSNATTSSNLQTGCQSNCINVILCSCMYRLSN